MNRRVAQIEREERLTHLEPNRQTCPRHVRRRLHSSSQSDDAYFGPYIATPTWLPSRTDAPSAGPAMDPSATISVNISETCVNISETLYSHGPHPIHTSSGT